MIHVLSGTGYCKQRTWTTNQPTIEAICFESSLFSHRFRCIWTKILSLTTLKIKSGICLQKKWIYSRAAVYLGISRKTSGCNLKKVVLGKKKLRCKPSILGAVSLHECWDVSCMFMNDTVNVFHGWYPSRLWPLSSQVPIFKRSSSTSISVTRSDGTETSLGNTTGGSVSSRKWRLILRTNTHHEV